MKLGKFKLLQAKDHGGNRIYRYYYKKNCYDDLGWCDSKDFAKSELYRRASLARESAKGIINVIKVQNIFKGI